MKVLIYSHIKDIDGMGAIILGKLSFPNLEYQLFPSPVELNKQVLDDISSHKYDECDRVFITDLTLPSPAIEEVEKHYKDKVRVFDHHHSAVEHGYDLYDFCTIKVKESNGLLTCGTRLFYEFLTREGFLEPTPALNELVEMIRLEDTWDWTKTKDGVKAHNLAVLHSVIGNEDFISHMLNCIQDKENFKLSSTDEQTIKNKKELDEIEINRLLEEMEYFTDQDNHKFGIVISTHEYVNNLSQKIRDLNNPNQIDYIIVVCLDSSSRSYRSIDYKNFNVSTIAVNHGGGGQFGAAAAGITEEDKQKILSMNKRDSLKYLADVKYKV